MQDQIFYDVGLSEGQPCLPMVKDDSFISDYRGGCLSMERWVALNQLFARTGYGLSEVRFFGDLWVPFLLPRSFDAVEKIELGFFSDRESGIRWSLLVCLQGFGRVWAECSVQPVAS